MANMTDQNNLWYQLPNGGKIERNYLMKCIHLARNETNYTVTQYMDESHAHCEICSTVISEVQSQESVNSGYFSNDVWLCSSCFELFVHRDFMDSISTLPTIAKPD